MRVKKSLFAVSAMALALLAFAGSALAVTEDKLVDSSNGNTIGAGVELHAVGWAKFFANNGAGGMECHVTSTLVTTGTAGTTAHVKSFTPVTSKCKGSGALTYAGCNELSADSTTNTNLGGAFIWDVTATTNDFDVFNVDGGEMVFHLKPKGSCVLNGTETTLTLPEITLKPLNTTNKRVVTNTLGNLGNEAATGHEIAGLKLSGGGTAHIGANAIAVTVSGELELSAPNRCTWKFANA